MVGGQHVKRGGMSQRGGHRPKKTTSMGESESIEPNRINSEIEWLQNRTRFRRNTDLVENWPKQRPTEMKDGSTKTI